MFDGLKEVKYFRETTDFKSLNLRQFKGNAEFVQKETFEPLWI